jgi:hypothetical protein
VAFLCHRQPAKLELRGRCSLDLSTSVDKYITRNVDFPLHLATGGADDTTSRATVTGQQQVEMSAVNLAVLLILLPNLMTSNPVTLFLFWPPIRKKENSVIKI